MTIKSKNAPKGPPLTTTQLSNKPPAPSESIPSPDPSLFVQSVALEDGRVIWVSLPLPDRLSFTSYFSKDQFSKGKGQGSGGFVQNVHKMVEGLVGAKAIYGTSEGWAKISGKVLLRQTLLMGARKASVRLTIFQPPMKPGDEPAFGLRLECNPRKLRPEGFDELLFVLQQAAPADFNLSAFLAKATVTRLDVAIDLAGVTPGELIAGSKQKAKRVAYWGADGHLETLQLHQAKKPPKAGLKKKPKALGKLLLKVYDRNRQRAALGKPPPYIGTTVTRLEIVRLRFTKGFGLAEIPTLKDAFAGVWVRDLESVAPASLASVWRAYVGCRSYMPHALAAEALALSKAQSQYAKALYSSPGDPLIPEGTWKGWALALERAGLDKLVKLASQ